MLFLTCSLSGPCGLSSTGWTTERVFGLFLAAFTFPLVSFILFWVDTTRFSRVCSSSTSLCNCPFVFFRLFLYPYKLSLGLGNFEEICRCHACTLGIILVPVINLFFDICSWYPSSYP